MFNEILIPKIPKNININYIIDLLIENVKIEHDNINNSHLNFCIFINNDGKVIYNSLQLFYNIHKKLRKNVIFGNTDKNIIEYISTELIINNFIINKILNK